MMASREGLATWVHADRCRKNSWNRNRPVTPSIFAIELLLNGSTRRHHVPERARVEELSLPEMEGQVLGMRHCHMEDFTWHSSCL